MIDIEDAYLIWQAGMDEWIRPNAEPDPRVAVLVHRFRIRWLEERMANLPLHSDAPDWLRALADDRTVGSDEEPLAVSY